MDNTPVAIWRQATERLKHETDEHYVGVCSFLSQVEHAIAHCDWGKAAFAYALAAHASGNTANKVLFDYFSTLHRLAKLSERARACIRDEQTCYVIQWIPTPDYEGTRLFDIVHQYKPRIHLKEKPVQVDFYRTLWSQADGTDTRSNDRDE